MTTSTKLEKLHSSTFCDFAFTKLNVQPDSAGILFSEFNFILTQKKIVLSYIYATTKIDKLKRENTERNIL